jgi:hypothetical protein
MDPNELLSSIAKNQRLFDDLISYIPQKYYKTEADIHYNKYQKNKNEIAPKQSIKEQTKKAKKAKVILY